MYKTTEKHTTTPDDPQIFMKNIKKPTRRFIKYKLNDEPNLKVQSILWVEFVNKNKDPIQYQSIPILSNTLSLLKTNVNNKFDEMEDKIIDSYNKAKQRGSGWEFNKIESYQIRVADWQPLKGSSYSPLPEKINLTRAVINIKNTKDNECFKWAIRRSDYPKEKNPQRINDLQKIWKANPSLYNFDGIEFPVKTSDISRFEKLNNKKINVFECNTKGEKSPVYLSSEPWNATDLLLYNEHYSLIKNFNRLNASITKHQHKLFFCKCCCHAHFSTQEKLDKHYGICKTFDSTRIIMPSEKNKYCEFKDYNKQMRVPFSIHCDFECLTAPVYSCNKENQKTTKYQNHLPSQFGMVVVSDDKDFQIEPIFYTGPNAHEVLLQKLSELQPQFDEKLKQNKRMIITKKQEQEFQKANTCTICQKEIKNKAKVLTKQQVYTLKDKFKTMNKEEKEQLLNVKVRDHDHITGLYRGPAHAYCNLTYKVCNHIPVIFHNLKGYDAHFILQSANNPKFGFKNIKCIPLNKEKYVSFSIDNYRFIDSFQFMSTSLEKLISNLKKSGGLEAFKITRKYYSGEKLDMLTRKGVCPYDYLDSFEKFDETCLPPKSAFYSKLNECDIKDSEYEFAQQMWKKFDCKTMKDYLELYLKTDVLCQADVFETFRSVCFKNYGLDPLHYFTAPGLAWDALFKKTGEKIELITDLDKYMFFEKGKRGGISMIVNRLGQANNKYMKNFDKNKPTKFIAYLDANNLYGLAMVQKLPCGNYQWCDVNDFDENTITNLKDDDETGYAFEVDLQYPKELHDLHNDYPVAPENILIKKEMLSNYNKDMLEKNQLKHVECGKLVPNLMDKKNYIVHYRNLKLYLSLGLKITKIHRVMSFTQKEWMKPYIDFNTEQRKQSKNDFEKDFYKLMNNSVFGKTMEDVRRHKDGKICVNEKQKNKAINNSRLKSWSIWGEEYGFFEFGKKEVVLNKPIQVGFSVLDLSKITMYDFHYNYILPKYGKKSKLLFTDTDSLCYEIETNELFEDMKTDSEKYDLSEFSKDFKTNNGTQMYDDTNKKVLGKMKLETSDKVAVEFVGLRSKLYSLLLNDGDDKKVCKGIKKCVKDNKIRHQNYKETLSGKNQNVSQRTIRSYDHSVFSIEMNKIALSAVNDKRHMVDNVFGFSYGHYNIN